MLLLLLGWWLARTGTATITATVATTTGLRLIPPLQVEVVDQSITLLFSLARSLKVVGSLGESLFVVGGCVGWWLCGMVIIIMT